MAAVLVDFGMSETEVLFGGSTNDIQLEDSCSLHSLYLYIHIHTCFTYCLYLNRNKYT